MDGTAQFRAAACWAHLRRDFHDVWTSTRSEIAKEALDRIGKLYDIERWIAGQSAEVRRAVRQEIVPPVLRVAAQAPQISSGSRPHHGRVVKAESAPSSYHDKGWVSGSMATFRLSLMARKLCSTLTVMSRDCGIAAQASWSVSNEVKGSASPPPPPAPLWASNCDMLMGNSFASVSHHSRRRKRSNVSS